MFDPHWHVKVQPSPRPLGAVQMLLQHLPEVTVVLAHEVKSTMPVQVRHVPATHWPTAHSPAVTHACPAFFLHRLSLHVKVGSQLQSTVHPSSCPLCRLHPPEQQ
jgi:hypothetical protein